MITLVVGLNGQGKTIYLRSLLGNASTHLHHSATTYNPNRIITNLTPFEYNGFDSKRLEIVTDFSSIEDIFDYHDIIVSGNRLVLVYEGAEYEQLKHSNLKGAFSDHFMDLVTLMCRPGNILILDAPDFNLPVSEIGPLIRLLDSLRDTYSEIYIATHCSRLFCLGEKILWIQNHEPIEITEQQLYKSIGTIRR